MVVNDLWAAAAPRSMTCDNEKQCRECTSKSNLVYVSDDR